jgi:dipeptidyl aminopeptidase B
VPDWVYEEEVFSGESALWWSPDSTQLAFLSLDETAVPEFVFPIYNPSENNDKVVPYTNEVRMKYPKPGYANPLASVHVFDLKAYQDARGDLDPEDATLTLEWNGAQAADNQVIQEVAWVGNQTLIVKEVNRAATNGSAVLFDLAQGRDVITGLSSPQGTVVRRLGKNGEEGDDGWIDAVGIQYYLYFTLLTICICVHKHSRSISTLSLQHLLPVESLHISMSCPPRTDTITSRSLALQTTQHHAS